VKRAKIKPNISGVVSHLLSGWRSIKPKNIAYPLAEWMTPVLIPMCSSPFEDQGEDQHIHIMLFGELGDERL